MGLLDELKKLTKPYDDEDYLEEDLEEPVRVPVQDNRGYAAYAEPPREQEPARTPRRPYVFSQPRRQQQAQQAPAYADYGAQQQAYPQQQGYQAYAQQQAYPQQQGYAQQQSYAQPARGEYYTPSARSAYAQPAAPQTRLLLVRPDRFEVAADIADRIAERNSIVLNLEETQKDVARRMLDFLSGVTYALDGRIRKVAGSTYVITPAGVDLAGEGLDGAAGQDTYF